MLYEILTLVWLDAWIIHHVTRIPVPGERCLTAVASHPALSTGPAEVPPVGGITRPSCLAEFYALLLAVHDVTSDSPDTQFSPINDGLDVFLSVLSKLSLSVNGRNDEESRQGHS
jgi:hypothetical protein